MGSREKTKHRNGSILIRDRRIPLLRSFGILLQGVVREARKGRAARGGPRQRRGILHGAVLVEVAARRRAHAVLHGGPVSGGAEGPGTATAADDVGARHARAGHLHGLGERGLLGQVAQHGARGVEHLHGEVEELGALAADAERPAVLAQARFVEVGLFLRRRRRPQQPAERPDQREVDLRREVPERLQVLWLQPVHKVHR